MYSLIKRNRQETALSLFLPFPLSHRMCMWMCLNGDCVEIGPEQYVPGIKKMIKRYHHWRRTTNKGRHQFCRFPKKLLQTIQRCITVRLGRYYLTVLYLQKTHTGQPTLSGGLVEMYLRKNFIVVSPFQYVRCNVANSLLLTGAYDIQYVFTVQL